MPRLPRVKLLKQIKVNDKWMLAPALFDSKGRVRRDHVRVKGKDEIHPEGSYFIEWWDEGRRHREAAGADAFDAADKARVKQAELSAQRTASFRRRPTSKRLRNALHSPLRSTAISSIFAITDRCVPSAPTVRSSNRSKSSCQKALC